jgi:serine/threonine-protein kinase
MMLGMSGPRRRRIAVASLATAIALVWAADVHAEPTTSDAVAAQALFDAARALMSQGDFAAACPKLVESQRLQPGGGTIMYLALCHEGAGKTATAWAEFGEALSEAVRAHRADRERVAREHLAALERRLVRLEVTVSPAAAGLPGLIIKRDGEPIDRALWGSAIPVDPGMHVVEASAPGSSPWTANVDATKEGETVTALVPALLPPSARSRALGPSPAPVPAAPRNDTALISSSPSSPPAQSWGTQKTVAVGLGGLGVVAIAIGSGYAMQALGKKSDAERACPGGSEGPCAPDGVSQSKTAVTDGNIATAAFVAAGVFLGAAAVVWFTAPASDVTVAFGPSGVRLASTF